jgi:quercetin dioxygenase-like cupin family protein
MYRTSTQWMSVRGCAREVSGSAGRGWRGRGRSAQRGGALSQVPFTFGVEIFEAGHRTTPHSHPSAHELFFILAGALQLPPKHPGTRFKLVVKPKERSVIRHCVWCRVASRATRCLPTSARPAPFHSRSALLLPPQDRLRKTAGAAGRRGELTSGRAAGEGEGFCDGGRFPLAAGDVVVFPPRSLHGIDVGPSGRLYALVRVRDTRAPAQRGRHSTEPAQPQSQQTQPQRRRAPEPGPGHRVGRHQNVTQKHPYC